jgi:hypothetical protein
MRSLDPVAVYVLHDDRPPPPDDIAVILELRAVQKRSKIVKLSSRADSRSAFRSELRWMRYEPQALETLDVVLMWCDKSDKWSEELVNPRRERSSQLGWHHESRSRFQRFVRVLFGWRNADVNHRKGPTEPG